MAEYLIAYVGVKQVSEEEGASNQQKWQGWLQGLGDAVVNPGTPLSQNKVVGESGTTDPADEARITGFTTVRADSLEAALEMARGCPYIGFMGTVQVAEVMSMG